MARQIGIAKCKLTGRVWEIWTDGIKVWIRRINNGNKVD